MNLRTKIELIAGIVIFAALCFVLVAWHENSVGMAQAQARSEMHDAEIKAAQKSIADAEQRIKDRDAQAAQDRQAFIQQLASIRTPQQAQPIIVDATRNYPGGPVQMQVDQGTGNATLTLTPQQQVAAAKDILTCDQNKKDLDTCHADMVDLKAVNTNVTQQRDSYKAEAADWKKAAKGSFWKKAGKTALVLGIGVGAGYAIAHH